MPFNRTQYKHTYKNKLVYAKTGDAISRGLSEREINDKKEKKEIITLNAFCSRQYRSKLADNKIGKILTEITKRDTSKQCQRARRLVDSKTGVDISTALSEREITVKKEKKEIISLNAFHSRTYRNKLVDARTGIVLKDQSASTIDKINRDNITTLGIFKQRQRSRRLVDAQTGVVISTELSEKEIIDKKEKKEIITVAAFRSRQHSRRLVDAKTGIVIPTELTEREILIKKEKKEIITAATFRSRQPSRKLVDAKTGCSIPVGLSKKEIAAKRKSGEVTADSDFQRKKVDLLLSARKNANFFQLRSLNRKRPERLDNTLDKNDTSSQNFVTTAPVYSQQLSFWQGAAKMKQPERIHNQEDCELSGNAAKNSSAKSIDCAHKDSATNYLISPCEERELLNTILPSDQDWFDILQFTESPLFLSLLPKDLSYFKS